MGEMWWSVDPAEPSLVVVLVSASAESGWVWQGGGGWCCVGLFVAVCWMGTREMLWFVAVVGVGGEGDGGTDVCCCCCCCGGDYLARLLGGLCGVVRVPK